MKTIEELRNAYDNACLVIWKAMERRNAVWEELLTASEEDWERSHGVKKGDVIQTLGGKKVRYVRMHHDKLNIIICNDMRLDGEWGTREIHYDIKEF